MNQNIEIKAHARDFAHLQEIAAQLSDHPPQTIYQIDTFFPCPHGRLKLRTLAPNRGELIFYQRANQTQPKPSHYLLTPTTSPDTLRDTLTTALGILGTVRKERLLYRTGSTRIHLDTVEELGRFLELEVVLQPDQTPPSGIALAHNLLQELEIQPRDLIDRAYIDLLLEKNPSTAS